MNCNLRLGNPFGEAKPGKNVLIFDEASDNGPAGRGSYRARRRKVGNHDARPRLLPELLGMTLARYMRAVQKLKTRFA